MGGRFFVKDEMDRRAVAVSGDGSVISRAMVAPLTRFGMTANSIALGHVSTALKKSEMRAQVPPFAK